MRKTVFIKNAAILTVSSLVLRFVGIFFKLWLAAKIGAEGIGLYQLAFSFYMFVSTFATSGICTAVTRLVSEELVTGNKKGVKKILFYCIFLSILIAFFSILVLFFGSNFIATNILQDSRTAISLKTLSFSLPFMGFCSCVKGYFIARRRAAPTSYSQLIEQFVRIAVIVGIISNYGCIPIEYACSAVFLGDTLAEFVSCLFIYFCYKSDFKKLITPSLTTQKKVRLLPIISHIALPITLGRYLNSLLRMIENILVPVYLAKASPGGNGLSLFGMIKGMALPILFFPSTLLSSLSTLLLPEMSEEAIKGRMGVVRSICYRIIKITALISIIFSALFLVCGKSFGKLLYNSEDVGFLLCALSPIVPFMYLDALCDGILKGLDQQKFTFITSVGDSAIRIVLIIIFLKQWGIYGFIGIMYFSNLFTAILNICRLAKVTSLKIDFSKTFLIPYLCAFSLCLFLNFLFKTIFNMTDLIFVTVICVICLFLYVFVLFALKIITRDDMLFLKQK